MNEIVCNKGLSVGVAVNVKRQIDLEITIYNLSYKRWKNLADRKQ